VPRTCQNERGIAVISGHSRTPPKRFDLKPHLADGFKISSDPLFVEKVVDVVGLYHHPPQKAVVLCVDELCEASHNSSDVKSSVM